MKILELNLHTCDLTQQKDFYTKKLGLNISKENESSFTVKTGNSKLRFTCDEAASGYYYHFAFNIPENQINQSAEWLKNFLEPLRHDGSSIVNFPNWNAHSVYFFDPQGNIVEFIARHNLNNSAKDDFSARSIINISEVGMPVESVAGFYNELNKSGLGLWWGNLETFAAIGDEEGLFIAVTKERNWFMTDKPCNIYPLEVKAEPAGSISYLLYKVN